MNQESVLEKICNGDLVIGDAPIYKTEEHKADEKALQELRYKLEELLDDNGRDLLDQYITLSLSIGAYYTQEQVKDAIAIGLSLNDELVERLEKFM